jgi:hypothetical protein
MVLSERTTRRSDESGEGAAKSMKPAAPAAKPAASAETGIVFTKTVAEVQGYERIQTRENPDGKTIAGYKERMDAGESFPPITVYSDGSVHYFVDGFHRLEAAIQCGRSEVQVQVIEGDRKTAVNGGRKVRRGGGPIVRHPERS